jgi:hypothetical protein
VLAAINAAKPNPGNAAILKRSVVIKALIIGSVLVGSAIHDNARNGVSSSPLIIGISIKNKTIKTNGRPINTKSRRTQKPTSKIDLINSLSLKFGAITDIYLSASTGQ